MDTSVDFMEIVAVDDALVVRPLANMSEYQYRNIESSVAKVLAELERTGLRNVVVDFRLTTYFGSSAVEALIRIGQEVRRRGGTMILENLTDAEREVLDILHVGQLWSIREQSN